MDSNTCPLVVHPTGRHMSVLCLRELEELTQPDKCYRQSKYRFSIPLQSNFVIIVFHLPYRRAFFIDPKAGEIDRISLTGCSHWTSTSHLLSMSSRAGTSTFCHFSTCSEVSFRDPKRKSFVDEIWQKKDGDINQQAQHHIRYDTKILDCALKMKKARYLLDPHSKIGMSSILIILADVLKTTIPHLFLLLNQI